MTTTTAMTMRTPQTLTPPNDNDHGGNSASVTAITTTTNNNANSSDSAGTNKNDDTHTDKNSGSRYNNGDVLHEIKRRYGDTAAARAGRPAGRLPAAESHAPPLHFMENKESH